MIVLDSPVVEIKRAPATAAGGGGLGPDDQAKEEEEMREVEL